MDDYPVSRKHCDLGYLQLEDSKSSFCRVTVLSSQLRLTVASTSIDWYGTHWASMNIRAFFPLCGEIIIYHYTRFWYVVLKPAVQRAGYNAKIIKPINASTAAIVIGQLSDRVHPTIFYGSNRVCAEKKKQ